jgi:phage terminase large subunit
VTETLPALRHVYEPWGACAELFRDRSPEVLMSGPAGTGKSRGCLEKLHWAAMANPGMRGLIVRKTAVSMTSTALVTWREFVIPEAEAGGLVRFYGGSPAEPAQYIYSNGSRVLIGGMDRATKLMSSEYDAVYVQEAIELTEDDWQALTTRLRHGRMSYQQLMADTNPDTDIHWLKQRCDAGHTRFIACHHEDNPRVYNRDGTLTARGRVYMARLDALTGVRRARLRDGLWVAAEGTIYEEEWDPGVNLVDRFVPPREWRRWWVIDFGYTNPFVWQRWAEDPDGRLWMYGERYLTRRLVEDHARAMLAQVAPDGRWLEPEPDAIICDHDAEGRATLERHLGRSTTPANKAVLPGIEATQARMRPAGDGKPRLFVMRDCLDHDPDSDLVDRKLPTCTAQEIGGYVWRKPAPGRQPKEEPVKENDHGLDCMRYVVAERDLGGRPTVRWL